MRLLPARSSSLLVALAALAARGVRAEEAPPLELQQTIPLQGVRGRFDHFAIDPKGKRLFVAALGNNTLEVLDLAAGRRLKTISGLRKPTGVAYVVERDRVAVAGGDDGTIKLFSGTSYDLVETIDGLEDADNVRLDRLKKRLYVGYGEGALAVIDVSLRASLSAKMAKATATISLEAHPESFQLEHSGPRIFVNVPGAKHIAVIDREKRVVLEKWPLGDLEANFPMTLDEPGHRLLVGCRQPARLLVLDTSSGKPVQTLEISGDTDDLFLDAARKRLYLSCGEGFLDVVGGREGDHLERIARIPTRAGARTCYFSPELDRLYLALPEREGKEAELRVYRPQPAAAPQPATGQQPAAGQR